MSKHGQLFLIALVAAVTTAGCGSSSAGSQTPNQTAGTPLPTVPPNQAAVGTIPGELQRAFAQTNWEFANSKLEKAIPGGPPKDGIPSIDTPEFLPIETFEHSDSVQAIVLQDGQNVKVYPYNILNWHEIVNDTVAGVPVAVTFCPLCGSAIVFDRRVNAETLTFGVSGFLLESNMIMFDRENEALWQQSTGRVLAGRDLTGQLALVPFQLMTIGEVKKMYPKALVLSQDTGHNRDYGRNPYSGYEDSESYYFPPSKEDTRYPSKTIFVVFRYDSKVIGVPFPEIADGKRLETSINGDRIALERRGQVLSIVDPQGNELPFYFEMWFSFATQHEGDAIVFDPSK